MHSRCQQLFFDDETIYKVDIDSLDYKFMFNNEGQYRHGRQIGKFRQDEIFQRSIC